MSSADLPRIETDFPGGNVLVESIEPGTVRLRPDLRDTEGDWFYWYFAVKGAAGPVRFDFTRGPALGARGPALSRDGGRNWNWLGADVIEAGSFEFDFANAPPGTRFSVGMPYVQRDLKEFLLRHASNPALRRETLCRSAEGREVELIRLGPGSSPRQKVLITCRHHACEMMANYVAEGILEAAMGDGNDARWLAANVEFLVVPFIDKDGVENGDQGKNRRTRDHNRDYDGESLYPETAALRKRMPGWVEGGLRTALDLHCPYLKGIRSEMVYLVGLREPALWGAQQQFGRTLESCLTGPVPYRASNNLPFGEEWNTADNYGAGKSCAAWAGEFEEVKLSSTIEFPYANAQGEEVNQQTARGFGHDLGRAISRYLRAK